MVQLQGDWPRLSWTGRQPLLAGDGHEAGSSLGGDGTSRARPSGSAAEAFDIRSMPRSAVPPRLRQEGRSHFGNHRNFDAINHNGEVWFRGETTLDNGLTIGARIELEAEDAPDQIDQSFVYWQGGFGKIPDRLPGQGDRELLPVAAGCHRQLLRLLAELPGARTIRSAPTPPASIPRTTTRASSTRRRISAVSSSGSATRPATMPRATPSPASTAPARRAIPDGTAASQRQHLRDLQLCRRRLGHRLGRRRFLAVQVQQHARRQ